MMATPRRSRRPQNKRRRHRRHSSSSSSRRLQPDFSLFIFALIYAVMINHNCIDLYLFVVEPPQA